MKNKFEELNKEFNEFSKNKWIDKQLSKVKVRKFNRLKVYISII